MARRRRIPDATSAGRSDLCEWRPGEAPKNRHERRRRTAKRFRDALVAWCKEQGIELAVKNDGHHWHMKKDGKVLAEWWPSSAKLVLRQRWREGIHTHDAKQVREILEQLLEKEKGEPKA